MRRKHSLKRPRDLIAHTKKRAWERYGLRLTTHDVETIAEDIRSNEDRKATFHGRSSNNRTRWLVNVQGHEVAVIYDKTRKAICTLMPVAYLGKPDWEFIEKEIRDDL